MKTLFALVLGLLLGVAGAWLYFNHPDATGWIGSRRQPSAGGTNQPGAALQEKLRLLHLDTANLQEELARGGQVIRRAARDLGRALADATADARITAAIKAKYVADPRLSALRISVNCTDGRVTLAGSVPAPEDIGRAMLLAFEADGGVREVVSTLQVRP